jgi:hypothetical protein
MTLIFNIMGIDAEICGDKPPTSVTRDRKGTVLGEGEGQAISPE